MTFPEIENLKWAEKWFLIACVVCLAQASDGCYYKCCCPVGHEATTIVCKNAEFAPLPPLPNDTGRWCGGNQTQPKGGEITAIDLHATDANHIEKDAFQAYPNVKVLTLAFCKFKTLGANAFSVPGTVSQIEEIDLQYNQIESIHEDAFAGLSKLKRLDLTGNSIKSFPSGIFKGLDKLERLWLGKNKISTIEASIFAPCVSLKTVSLESNAIMNLQPFPSLLLTELKLGNNSIMKLQSDVFGKLTQLDNLDLSNNKIGNLPDDIFSRNYGLMTIDLGNNRLKSLGKEIFSDLCSSRKLNLRGNRLTFVHTQWFANVVWKSDERTTTGSEKRFRDLPANGENPWNCDSENVEIMEYAFFLTKICNDTFLKSIDLLRYLNIQCSSGRMLVNSKTCKATTAQVLTEKEKLEILSRNKEAECKKKKKNPNPACPYLSPRCAKLPKLESTTDGFSEPVVNSGLPRPAVFAMVAVAILITIILVLVAYRLMRTRVERKRRHESSSTIDSESASRRSSGSNFIGERPDEWELTASPYSDNRSTPSPPFTNPVRPHQQPHPDTRFGATSPNHPTDHHNICPTMPPVYPITIIPSVPSDPFYLLPAPSFSFLPSNASRPNPLGSSEPASTAPSVIDFDELGSRSDFRTGSSISSQTDPKEVVTGNTLCGDTVPKCPVESRDISATQPKGLWQQEETAPKEHPQSHETRPKEHPHLQPRPGIERTGNKYGATPMQHPQNTTNENPDRNLHENAECAYTPMAPQPPPIPPRKSAPMIGAPNLQRGTHPAQDLAFQQLHHNQPPSCASCSHHYYMSIPFARNIPPPPTDRPPMPPPQPCQNCYLYWRRNPVHLPEVRYREAPKPSQTRPRSDQQPLLSNMDTSSGEKISKKKKKEKHKKKN